LCFVGKKIKLVVFILKE